MIEQMIREAGGYLSADELMRRAAQQGISRARLRVLLAEIDPRLRDALLPGEEPVVMGSDGRGDGA